MNKEKHLIEIARERYEVKREGENTLIKVDNEWLSPKEFVEWLQDNEKDEQFIQLFTLGEKVTKEHAEQN